MFFENTTLPFPIIIALEGSGIVGADAERPYFLNRNLPVVALNQSDLVQKPVRARFVGRYLTPSVNSTCRLMEWR